MIVMKHRRGDEEAWKRRYCCECRFFLRVPFTVGRCGRKGDYCAPSITDERAASGLSMFPVVNDKPRCGPAAQFFIAKTQEAA